MTDVNGLLDKLNEDSQHEAIRVENEQKLISYFIRNPAAAAEIDTEVFLHPFSKAIVRAIKILHEKQLNPDIDTIHTISQEFEKHITWELVDGIYKKFENFDNIKFVKEELQNDYVKSTVRTKLVKEILAETVKKDTLSNEKLQAFAEDILYNIIPTSRTLELLNAEELSNLHFDTIQKRNAGLFQRSLGFRNLDELITRPAAAEEMTLLVGQKGSSKSVFTKTIENNLLAKQICVLSINLEMSMQSNIDRLLCIRNGIPLREMQQINMNPRTIMSIQKGLDELSQIKHYLYSPIEYMDLPMLDATIYKAKSMFRDMGVLPDDGYLFVAIDSLDMIKGFDEAYDIKKSIEILHSIYRKHKCHVFAIVQANENKFRTSKMWTKPEELDDYHITLSDIFGGSYYAARARVVMSINRPLHLKMQFFPERMEQWNIEDDILYCSIIKQNDGILGQCRFLFDDNFKISPLTQDICH